MMLNEIQTHLCKLLFSKDSSYFRRKVDGICISDYSHYIMLKKSTTELTKNSGFDKRKSPHIM